MAPSTDSVMGSVPKDEAGVGSATSDTSLQVGGALGVAVLGTALNLRYQHLMTALIVHHAMPPAIHDVILGSLGGALQVAARIPGPTGTALADAARQSFVSGMDLALLIACIVVAAAACVVLLALPQRPSPPGTPRKYPADRPHTVTPPAAHPRCRFPARQRPAQALADPAQAPLSSRHAGQPAIGHRRRRDRISQAGQPVQRQQHHHCPRCVPPQASQAGPQPLDLTSRTAGEHADRPHTEHDLAGWVADGGNLDPTRGEAACRSPGFGRTNDPAFRREEVLEPVTR
jgi:hypothetical protein